MAIGVLDDSSRSSRLSDQKITWSLCVVAGLAVLLCSVRGIGMDADSTGYLSAAVNLARGHGLVGFGQSPFTLFGPALPGFVSIGVRLGMSPQWADLILNVVSAVLTVILGRILLMRHVVDPRLVLGGSVFVAIGWPLLQVTSLALTEPLTIVVVLLLVLALEDFHNTRKPMITLAVIVLLLNLGFFLRYAGLAFIPAAVIVVFFSRVKIDGLFRRIIYSSVTMLFAFLGPVLWMLRNHSVDGSLLGPRYPAVFGVVTVAHQYVLAIGKLFLPGPDIFEELVFVVVVLLVALALRMVWTSVAGVGSIVRRIAPWAVLLLLTVTYVLYVYAAELSTSIDPIDSRLLAPIYVPSVILLVGLANAVFSSGAIGVASQKLVRLGLAAFLCVQVLITCVLVGDFAVVGRDFTSTPWRTSSLITASKSLAGVTAYYTNNTGGLWARLGEEDIFGLPDSISQARKDLSCPGARVVYFTAPPGPYYGGSNAVSAASTSVKLTALKAELNEKVLFASNEGEILGPGVKRSAQSDCR